MECQSLQSPTERATISSARRHSTTRRRGNSSTSSHVQILNRNFKRATSTPRPTRRSGRGLNQSSIDNPSSILTNESNINVHISLVSPSPSTNPPRRSQVTVPPLPFGCSSDDEQHHKQNVQPTTRSGKMKKDAVFSYFTLRPDGRYDCNICHQIRQKQLDEAIVDCIIDDSLPFTMFTKLGMINLLKSFEPRYEPPSRFTIASRTLLQRTPSVAFTADIWKSGARKYYISLTAHLFDKDFEVVPLVLSLRQLTGRHLAVNVQSFIMFELDEKFQIMSEQRVGIATDCGREMVAATLHGLFGPRYACIAHVWNNVIKNGLCLWSPPNPTK
ncbi:unnamed protein product [Rotaria magnacalcarata]|uniref:Uncharacterized protein n=1 Tax=Rotaria magnacalcarata TaxID=392030 RepID=A0A8S2NQ08_9BILA|nr:unnamed protein product [Rotaria magnacalcarata]